MNLYYILPVKRLF